ncbi:MAG: hypothetical protein SFU98_05965 [Leptospiraceae bacterium]|nr:hypothetical protein [Leptospiraceae bacterium]
MNRYIQQSIILFLCFTLSIYSEKNSSKNELYPLFTVTVKLTKPAEKKLKEKNRTVSVSFEFGNDLGPDSENSIYLNHEIKGNSGGTFSTKELKLTKKQLKRIGTNYDAAVGGFSTHKTKNSLNILDCSIETGSYQPPTNNIKDYLNKEIVILCDLLKEN